MFDGLSSSANQEVSWLRGVALVKDLTSPFGVSGIGLVQFCEDKLKKKML